MNKEERIKKFKELMYTIEDQLPTGFINEFISKYDDFFTAPASTKYHGSYEGGLFDHSYEVAKQLINLTTKLGLVWKSDRSPILVGMFHDLCKIDAYVSSSDGEEYEYNCEKIIDGHGEKSVILLSPFTQLTEEEILCIRYHMGAYYVDEQELFGRAIESCPNVLYTHTADMIASKIEGV